MIKKIRSGEIPSSEPDGLAIGESDSHVFNCPSCARPLAEGTSKCPGCGTRLIMGVRAKVAGSMLLLGAAIGVLLGGVGTAAAINVGLNEPAAVTPTASANPSGAPSSARPSLPVEPAGPVAAISALSGTAVVNGRIVVDAQTLASTLDRADATTVEISRAIRSLAADAALGIDLAGRLQPWTDAIVVRSALDAFYHDMALVAKDGLRASLSDKAGYRASGVALLAVLKKLGDVDALSRTLAESVDVELPPVALPSAAP